MIRWLDLKTHAPPTNREECVVLYVNPPHKKQAHLAYWDGKYWVDIDGRGIMWGITHYAVIKEHI